MLNEVRFQNIDSAVAIVVPTYNRKEITRKFIERIREQCDQISVYVCDSESSDGTVQALSSICGVKVINVGRSSWWSAAVNRGIDLALAGGHTAIIIMNDDIEFENDLLARLIQKHNEFPNAIISPMQDTPSGPFLGLHYVGWAKNMKILRWTNEDMLVDTTNGCCLLVPTAVFGVAGNIDEIRCPHQYGDTEFQLRAKLAGFPTLACPRIKIAQLGATNYYARLRLGSMLNFPGSPLHFPAYSQFGRTLFGGGWQFLFCGMQYHYRYVKTLVKALLHLVRKNLFRS